MKRIISASYKDDTPAFQSEEFFAALQRGYAEVSGKFGIQRISLRPEDVYCIVFWTKNPSDHFLANMGKIQSPFYFQWTISGYGNEIEPNVPDKYDVVKRFISLAKRIGRRRVVWRYDPIFISDVYSIEAHKEAFGNLCAMLHGYTERCVISFMDEYGKLKPLVDAGVMRAPTDAEVYELSRFIGETAARYGIKVQTCSEGKYDLSAYGINEAPCVDAEFIEREFGVELPASVKTPNSFRRCLCAVNTDIGQYHRCQHGCAYCYAK